MEHVLCPISEHALAVPTHPALITDEKIWNYRELDRAISSLCHFLTDADIKEGQRIAFIAKTEPSTIVLLFALFRLGAIACPISFRLPQEPLTKSLELLQPAHILEPSTLPLNFAHGDPEPISHSLHSSATFLFTSGSSGTPKIACHSYANHYYNALGAAQPLQLNADSRWLLSLPLFHVSGIGILFRCFQNGAAVVLSDKSLTEALSHFAISHLSVVPTQLLQMVLEPGDLPPSLKCILLGGAPIPPDLLRRARNKNYPVFTTYGLTETGSMMTLSDENPHGHSGRLLEHRELKINEDGEIHVGGKTLFQGYWDASQETIVKADVNGWFPTKDLGAWTPAGNLKIIGRKDRMFISGGENIQPEEIELALSKVPGIRQAFVLPVDDPEFGQRPAAFIDDATGSHTLQSIKEALSHELPSFKHPVRILPYPQELGLKPNLAILKQHLAHSPGSPSENQG